MKIEIIKPAPTDSGASKYPEDRCPLLDLRDGRRVSPDEVRAFVHHFTAFFFELPLDEVRDDSRLVDDLEARFYGAEVGSLPDYGRIGITRDGEGGISDRGLGTALYLLSLAEAMGVIVSLSKDDDRPDDDDETVGTLIEFILGALRNVDQLST